MNKEELIEKLTNEGIRVEILKAIEKVDRKNFVSEKKGQLKAELPKTI